MSVSIETLANSLFGNRNTILEEFTPSPFQGETREEYLAWRAEWKKQYNDLSNWIRAAKASRKQNRYEYLKSGMSKRERQNSGVKTRRVVGKNPLYCSEAADTKIMLSIRANRYMQVLEDAKEVAREQRQKRLQEQE